MFSCPVRLGLPLITKPSNQPSLLKIEPLKNPKTPLPSSKLVFGKTFTDHMLMIPWSSESGWAEPLIKECRSSLRKRVPREVMC